MATQYGGAGRKRARNQCRLVFSRRAWPLQVIVFGFENGPEDESRFLVELTRSYCPRKGSRWKMKHELRPEDLLPAARLLTDAYSYIQGHEEVEFGTDFPDVRLF